MARGWESKSVESQIDAAREQRARQEAVRLTPDQLRRERERESLEMSRNRVVQDLAAATNPRYRELLERTLQALDEKIAALGEKAGE